MVKFEFKDLVIFFNIRRSKRLRERGMTRFLREHYQNKKEDSLLGAEIGVYKGLNALNMLSNLNIDKLFLIDPFIMDKSYKESFGNELPVDENIFVEAKKNLSYFSDKVSWIKDFSYNAIDKVSNGLDFVYIDGNHTYKYVKQDIELYYTKLKTGGVIGGDNFEATYSDVPRAVLEFVDNEDLCLYGEGKDWWVVKK